MPRGGTRTTRRSMTTTTTMADKEDDRHDNNKEEEEEPEEPSSTEESPPTASLSPRTSPRRQRSATTTKLSTTKKKTTAKTDNHESDESAEEEPPKRKRRSARASSPTKKKAVVAKSDESEDEKPSPKRKRRAPAAAPAKKKDDSDDGRSSDSEGEENEGTPKRKRRSPAAAAAKTSKKKAAAARKAGSSSESEQEGGTPKRKRRSPAAAAKTSKKKAAAGPKDGSSSESEGETPKRKRRSPTAAKTSKKKTPAARKAGSSSESEGETPKRKRRSPAAAAKNSKKKAAASKDDKESSDADKPSKKASPARRKSAPKHQVVTDRDPIERTWSAKDTPKGSYPFTIASWNVAGLRALLKKNSQSLRELVEQHDIDVLCLQETKLQSMHVDELLEKEEDAFFPPLHEAHFSCSTVKKGYSGTAVFVRRRGKQTQSGKPEKGESKKKQTSMDMFVSRKASSEKATAKNESESNSGFKDALLEDFDQDILCPTSVSFKMGVEKHDGEGRMIIVEFPSFVMCNVYVPNSGQSLDRLPYRVDEWDKDFLAFMQSKQQETKKPVMWLGDLNVAHTKLEVWNDGAKHLPKQAGVTPQERASFQEQLDAGFVDAFRALFPEVKGHYSYWSQRAGNREPNKGLRLDYFITDPDFWKEESPVRVRDSYMIPDHYGSDHCPVVLQLELRGRD